MTMKDIMLRNQGWPSMSLHKDMDGFFNRFFDDFNISKSWKSKDRFASFAPKLNVSEDESSIEISVELPGMNEKDIEVSLDKDVLTIKGEKKEDSETRKKSYHHMERSFGTFQRSIRISKELTFRG
jgi:HSP20 family protein